VTGESAKFGPTGPRVVPPVGTREEEAKAGKEAQPRACGCCRAPGLGCLFSIFGTIVKETSILDGGKGEHG